MVQPPPPPYWPPPRASPWQSPGALVGVVVAAAVLAVFVIFFLAGVTVMGPSVGSFVFLPFCGVLVAVILIVILVVATQSMGRPALPPPPPIRQPMVPAGMQGPVALACPNCGAPPQAVDRFGVATCTYCGTRFLVR